MALIFLFYGCGLVINGYLFYRLYKSWNISVSKGLNKVVSFQLFLNICNIVSHAALEVSKRPVWIVLSSSFSFQTIYLLVAIEIAAVLGRPLQQQINSALFIVVLTFASTGLATVFGRRYELCGTNNCFVISQLRFSAEDDSAILKSYLAHFLLPTAVILFASFYHGFRRYERISQTTPTHSCTSRLVRTFSTGAVSLFLLYGTVVAEIMLYSVEAKESMRPRHMCRVSCLYEELYLLLSMFPVGYLSYFFKQNEGKQQTTQEQP